MISISKYDVDKCSNPLLPSQAAMLRVLIRAKRGVYLIIEQPTSSFAFKTQWMMGVKALGSLLLDLSGLRYVKIKQVQ